MFHKILIANRGEIACRVIRTARRMGISTVAVYSDIDRYAQHVLQADEAVFIGSAPARESYLRIPAIIDAARETGAEAIHPGYGFLSENAEFAEAIENANLVFIGPPASAIRAMGSKSAAKAIMAKAEVPLVPGYHGEDQDIGFLKSQAASIGYPLLIKASAGGGGKGMRRVDRAEDFVDALMSARRESASAFGNDHVLLEKYILKPRHIEIQVFADTHGNVIHLFERDCSIQRRHQKVIEEAPAPHWPAQKRAAMGLAAVNAAKAIGYVGAGTVEFIVDPDGNFYFMEMNTRLQVEHPVTEMITGEDLVEWQLRVAAGEVLPKTQDNVRMSGHAIEVRIYAEDPNNEFRPAAGVITAMTLPPAAPWLRVDAGVVSGDPVSVYYDPMIAKLIVHAPDRRTAVQRLQSALREFHISGLTNNLPFLCRLSHLPDFRAGSLDTGLIERSKDFLLEAGRSHTPHAIARLCLAMLAERWTLTTVTDHTASPWLFRDHWQMNQPRVENWLFRHQDRQIPVRLEIDQAGATMSIDGQEIRGTSLSHGVGWYDVTIGNHGEAARLMRDGDKLRLLTSDEEIALEWVDQGRFAAEHHAPAGRLTAPMPGKIISVDVKPGQLVDRGMVLVVLEAMKMEHAILAPAPGRVQEVLCQPGLLVDEGAILVNMEAEDEPK